jgi:hypothetical protein
LEVLEFDLRITSRSNANARDTATATPCGQNSTSQMDEALRKAVVARAGGRAGGRARARARAHTHTHTHTHNMKIPTALLLHQW